MAPGGKRSYKQVLVGMEDAKADEEALLYLFERRHSLSSPKAEEQLQARWPQLSSSQRAALIRDVLRAGDTQTAVASQQMRTAPRIAGLLADAEEPDLLAAMQMSKKHRYAQDVDAVRARSTGASTSPWDFARPPASASAVAAVAEPLAAGAVEHPPATVPPVDASPPVQGAVAPSPGRRRRPRQADAIVSPRTARRIAAAAREAAGEPPRQQGDRGPGARGPRERRSTRDERE